MKNSEFLEQWQDSIGEGIWWQPSNSEENSRAIAWLPCLNNDGDVEELYLVETHGCVSFGCAQFVWINYGGDEKLVSEKTLIPYRLKNRSHVEPAGLRANSVVFARNLATGIAELATVTKPYSCSQNSKHEGSVSVFFQAKQTWQQVRRDDVIYFPASQALEDLRSFYSSLDNNLVLPDVQVAFVSSVEVKGLISKFLKDPDLPILFLEPHEVRLQFSKLREAIKNAWPDSFFGRLEAFVLLLSFLVPMVTRAF